MQQLFLDLEIVPENFQTSTYDPYWDEITQQDECVGEQPLTQFKVGDRVRDTSPIRPHDKEGEILQVHSTWCELLWDGWGHPSNHCLSDLEFALQQVSPCKSVGEQALNDTEKFAHQHISTYENVGEQVDNYTNGQQDNSCSPTHFVERYWVRRRDKKYNYFRYTWMEGRKMRRRYIGSTTSKKAIAKVEEVRDAIALGKMPCEIVELI